MPTFRPLTLSRRAPPGKARRVLCRAARIPIGVALLCALAAAPVLALAQTNAQAAGQASDPCPPPDSRIAACAGAACPVRGTPRPCAETSGQVGGDGQDGGEGGLAQVAERNGYPGPAGVLALADQLGLSAAQRQQIRQIGDAMRVEATAAGARLADAERALDDAFRTHAVTDEDLRYLIARDEDARAALRYIHLSRRLQVARVLSAEQIARYAQLRGCDAVGGAGAPNR